MRPRRLIELLSLLLLVTACRSAPTTRYYVLAPSNTAPETVATPTGGSGLRIGVEPFTVDPPYDRDQLVYRLGVDSVEVGFYSYHRWAAPLSELVAVAVAEGLRGTPGFGSSSRGRPQANTTHSFTGEFSTSRRSMSRDSRRHGCVWS